MRRAEESQLIGVAFGFTFGFGFLVARNALKQTHKANHFIVMVWIELIICLISSTLDFLFLIGAVRGTVPFFITILIQILFQIIINRISLIWSSPRHIQMLKWGIAVWASLISISVFCVWLPARLGSARMAEINQIWDRIEKCLYLITDGGLNFLFIRAIKKSLVLNGLTKYERLTKFNIRIIFLSLSLELEMSNLMVAVVKDSQELNSVKETIKNNGKSDIKNIKNASGEVVCVKLYP
ncbi:expressed protein [Phakopsora pachyrhizi]|uniref:Expressed protein n=1 Tax=Phakopsora pachyrhizi TaxID=170000 RepID=A0AAV0B063_PHAPC|nr:expressed protein [Phakopsora pachyrhizi]